MPVTLQMAQPDLEELRDLVLPLGLVEPLHAALVEHEDGDLLRGDKEGC